MIERVATMFSDRGRSVLRRSAALLALTIGASAMTGCETDSWLYDPSVVGRWEHTPTVVPILERIDVIERERQDSLQTTSVMPEDLLPEIREYEVGSGDTMVIEIWDFLVPNAPTQLQPTVDARGFIDIPQLGRLNVLGLNASEIRELVRNELRDQGIIDDALVTVQFVGQRQQTFSVFGSITGVGRYFIPTPNYRLLDALTEAGGVSPAIRTVYVIRQTPLSDAVRRGEGVDRATRPDVRDERRPTDQERGRELRDLIRDLTEPDGGSLGMYGAGVAPSMRQSRNNGDDMAPPIDLVDEPTPVRTPDRGERFDESARWMFLNGEWVRVARQERGRVEGLPEGADPLERLRAEDLVTQRIIEVPTEPLLQGVAEYNLVIRPGDMIRVPSPEQGFVYIGGPGIARGGTFSLPFTGRLTLTKAVISAGGLSQIAVPWRVDLTRMVGEDRQATIRLNLAAIFEGTQPDIFLKPDDVVNIGTSFWATPLAVIRNGFRMSYGFGFLLDRNFGNDVFGAPPTNFRN
ncbi:MAG: hypothetical protein EA376_04900 [Phycisphaeraceae bacterium]|nr:MAG: hypothetical protein EA376_04900 [Phycisphaeraceae bacterium]